MVSDPQNSFTLNPGNYDTNINTVNTNYLKNGGQYQIGLVGKDDAGRSGFVNTTDALLLSIPNIQDSPQGFKQTNLTVNFNGLVVPDWVDTLWVVRTQRI